MAPKVIETVVNSDPAIYEAENVHAVYDTIASHFSSTRYKPWPIIAKFLSTLPDGWVGLDSGTGNGKYLPLDREGKLWTIGLDRSINLLKIAQNAGGLEKAREVVLGNVLDDCWRPHCFDYAISIATIHHLATHGRRVSAVQRLLQAVSSDHGRVLIYVWAIEQDDLSKRVIPTEGDDTPGIGKDVVVPWVLSKSTNIEKASQDNKVYNRYYHMFAKDELMQLVREAAAALDLLISPKPKNQTKPCQGVGVVQNGWERSNYYVELQCWSIS